MFQRIYILLAFVFLSATLPEDNTYTKAYYDNGELKSEGWLRFNVKSGYWKFYHENGTLSSQGHYKYGKKEKYWYFYSPNRVRVQEGHFLNGEKINWWLFYDKQGRINHKCQLYIGVKNGYCLKYLDNKLTSAEKYSNGKKIKEWENFDHFNRKNIVSDLE